MKIKMKQYLIKYAGLFLIISLFSCTKDFNEINTDPTQTSPQNFNSDYFISNSQAQFAKGISGYEGPILFQSGWMQIFAMATTSGDYYANADKYVASSNTNDYTGRSWKDLGRAASLANEVIVNYGNNPAKVNSVAVATIMKVLCISYVSDAYGDVPYSQAFQVSSGITLPVYDKQQELYPHLLSDLEAAVNSIDLSKSAPAVDVSSLNGDMAKWKRFGYSLMLRMAMRLVKVDANAAKTWAEKAYAGGTLNSGEDVYFRSDNANGYGNNNINAWLTATDFNQVRWSKTLIDYLKSNADPRLSAIAEVPQPGVAAANNQDLAGDNTFATQLGLPNGYDIIASSPSNIANAPGYPGGTGTGTDLSPIGKYSRPSINVYKNRNLPVYALSYAESELLLAEAAIRGWNAGESAAAHYSNAAKAGVLSLNNLKDGVVSDAAATTYANAHPLDISNQANALNMINTQYWATTGILLNFSEAWNNWKRTGLPALTPINYTGNFSGGQIPRRQLYPLDEGTSNRANYLNAAENISGGDTWTGKIWWDK
ncbi:SusD/RagB family nutrient-binding outer membrane lipoprotein [Rubrolithibacter danxiaensis]|uniref:SusD/RagB family nutrient-binding outer membrane lipoprotein n=1 Tax=Rubrolithibacter danxiaensis TaxID=3390805 RepID=UPI003BF84C30